MGMVSRYRPAFMTLIADGEARCCMEIAEALHCGDKCVRRFMADLLTEGEVHIDSYRGKGLVAYYRFGPGANAERPALKTKPEVLEKLRVKSRKRAPAMPLDRPMKRVLGDWWPVADPVVVSAMVAMVRTGHTAP